MSVFVFKRIALNSVIRRCKNGAFRESDSGVREHRVQWICKNEIHRKACIMSIAEKQVRLKR